MINDDGQRADVRNEVPPIFRETSFTVKYEPKYNAIVLISETSEAITKQYISRSQAAELSDAIDELLIALDGLDPFIE